MQKINRLLDKAQKEFDNTATINTPLLSELISALVTIEYAPGGPYKSTDPLSEKVLNNKVEKLFSLLGKTLPNVIEYLKKDGSQGATPSLNKSSGSRIKLKTTTNNRVQMYVDSLSYEVKQVIQPILDKITIVDDNGEISKLSYFFSQSFKIKTTQHQLDLLGDANLLAWIAYTLYDNIIDGDAPAKHVSAAAIVNLESLRRYLKTSHSKGLLFNFYQKTNDANAFETHHCRFEINNNVASFKQIPRKQDLQYMLSRRASLHYLGPLILSLKSSKLRSRTMLIERAFEYYCIARQLNDDLHDWVDDFSNGRLTYVVVSLLHKLKIVPGKHDAKKLLSSLKEVYYVSELELLCNEVSVFIEKSDKTFRQLLNSEDTNLLYELYLLPITNSAQKAKYKHITNKQALNTHIKKTFFTS